MQSIVLLIGISVLLALPSSLPAASPESWKAPYEKAQSLYRIGKYAEAESPCRQAMGMAEKQFGNNAPAVADCLFLLGVIHEALKRYDEAVAELERCRSIKEKSFGARDRRLAPVIGVLVGIYEKKRDKEKSQALDELAYSLWGNPQEKEKEAASNPLQAQILKKSTVITIVPPAEEYKPLIKKIIFETFYDSHSLQDVSLSNPFRYRDRVVVCLKVNAKNRNGGYVGIRKCGFTISSSGVSRSLIDDVTCVTQEESQPDLVYTPWPDLEDQETE